MFGSADVRLMSQLLSTLQ
uniref:Uncharacterized protein MANES_17G100900 n=1 Tax=Rhizophora mucronata TaxID=61149 RepID=A0A2P2LY29_RHIMU